MRLKFYDSGSVECLVRPLNQTVREIDILGSPNLKGFDLQSNAVLVHDVSNSVSCPIHYNSYDNQLLCQYNIDCGEGQQAYINLTALDLQGDGEKECQSMLATQLHINC